MLLSFPVSASVCGKRYKNRPGLSYHYTHSHLADEEGEEKEETEISEPQTPLPETPKSKRPALVWLGGDVSGCGAALELLLLSPISPEERPRRAGLAQQVLRLLLG